MQGEKMSVIRVTYDIAILAENEKNLQDTLNCTEEVVLQMKINKKKTKVMKCIKMNNQRTMNQTKS